MLVFHLLIDIHYIRTQGYHYNHNFIGKNNQQNISPLPTLTNVCETNSLT